MGRSRFFMPLAKSPSGAFPVSLGLYILKKNNNDVRFSFELQQNNNIGACFLFCCFFRLMAVYLRVCIMYVKTVLPPPPRDQGAAACPRLVWSGVSRRLQGVCVCVCVCVVGCVTPPVRCLCVCVCVCV